MENTDAILVEIDETVTQCSCCGKEHLKRTLHLESIDNRIGDLYIGVICASRWFELNLTGNCYYAAAKLQRYVNNLDEDDFVEIVEQIKEAAEEW